MMKHPPLGNTTVEFAGKDARKFSSAAVLSPLLQLEAMLAGTTTPCAAPAGTEFDTAFVAPLSAAVRPTHNTTDARTVTRLVIRNLLTITVETWPTFPSNPEKGRVFHQPMVRTTNPRNRHEVITRARGVFSVRTLPMLDVWTNRPPGAASS
jgi:hypothetical protein